MIICDLNCLSLVLFSLRREKQLYTQNMFIAIQQASGRSAVRSNCLFLLDDTVSVQHDFLYKQKIQKSCVASKNVFALHKPFDSRFHPFGMWLQVPRGFGYGIQGEKGSKYLFSKNLVIFLKQVTQIPTLCSVFFTSGSSCLDLEGIRAAILMI